jgi:hypothetical protein
VNDIVAVPEVDASPRHAKDRLLLMSTDAMRARRRPLMLLFTWMWHAVAALAIAWPIASFVRDTWGHHPRGDVLLFEPGGLALSDIAMRPEGHAGLLSHATVVLVACAVLGLLPLGALITALGHARPDRGAPPLRACFERAAESFGAFARLLVIMGLVQVVVVVLGSIAAAMVSASLEHRMDDAAADLVGWFVFLVFLLLASFVGVVHDVARCAAIRYRSGALAALRTALRAVRPSPVGVTWSWLWRTLAGLVVIGAAAFVVHRVGVRDDMHLAAVAGLHQVAMLFQTALRASWLARAFRLVDATNA